MLSAPEIIDEVKKIAGVDTDKELAIALGIDQVTVSRWRTGARKLGLTKLTNSSGT